MVRRDGGTSIWQRCNLRTFYIALYTVGVSLFCNRPQDGIRAFPFAQPYLAHVPAVVRGDHQRIPAVDCFAFLLIIDNIR